MSLIPADAILEMMNTLAVIPEKTEKDFIGLGAFLQTLSQEVSDLVGQTGQSASLLLGEDHDILSNTQKLADSMIQSLGQNHDAINKSIDSVTEIINGLNQLAEFQANISHISKYLNAVAFNFVVETSRTRLTDQNFSILAREIKHLADQIHEISTGIKQDSESARSAFASTKDLISKRLDQTEKLVAASKTHLQGSIDETRGLIALSTAAIEKSNRSSLSIHSEIGNIIVAVQMHDNIRQRIEHIHQGLDDVLVLCSTETPLGNRAYTHEERLGLACKILKVQESQLQHIIEDLESVFHNNSKTFESILDEIDQFSGNLFDEKKNSSDKNPTSGITDSLNCISSLKIQGDAMISDVEEIAAQTLKSSRRLSGYISQVHTISKESQIKSLNAIISADKLMENGATLKVLAREMRAMTDKIDEFTAHVDRILNAVHTSSEKLYSNSSELKKGNSGNVSQTISDSLADISKTFETVNLHMGNIRKKGEHLKTLTRLAHNEISFFKSMAETLGAILVRLKKIKPGLEPYKKAFSGSLEDDPYFLNRYTMEKERNIHKKQSGRVQEKPLAAVSEENETLGDNIDLF
ncbi:MAG: methyl-accepting chemotaxis protein [Desulfobacula sp.]|nr:methyl-accepting chemotaxis protein [Desulfobacula sp.]